MDGCILFYIVTDLFRDVWVSSALNYLFIKEPNWKQNLQVLNLKLNQHKHVRGILIRPDIIVILLLPSYLSFICGNRVQHVKIKLTLWKGI